MSTDPKIDKDVNLAEEVLEAFNAETIIEDAGEPAEQRKSDADRTEEPSN